LRCTNEHLFGYTPSRIRVEANAIDVDTAFYLACSVRNVEGVGRVLCLFAGVG
uniref:Alcohol dehydrogenase n=1 Tax=Haemonchus placei TaxID=6290 RepID=A0A0N4WFX0_HAEPC